MASAPLFDTSGRKAGEVDLPANLFAREISVPLMHQKVVAENNAARQGTSNTLTRGQVAGGGKKPYRQKGTGRARQGTVSAPHYRHGGIVFGPHPRDYTQKMPKKMRLAALKSALSAKAAAGELLVIEDFSLSRISTREAALLLDAMEVTGKALVIIEDSNETVQKSLRNIPGVQLRRALDVSTRDVVYGGQLVVTKAALAKMEEVWL